MKKRKEAKETKKKINKKRKYDQKMNKTNDLAKNKKKMIKQERNECEKIRVK